MLRVTCRSSGRLVARSEEHTSELQSRQYLVCRLLLEKKILKNSTEKRSQIPMLELPVPNPSKHILTHTSINSSMRMYFHFVSSISIHSGISITNLLHS